MNSDLFKVGDGTLQCKYLKIALYLQNDFSQEFYRAFNSKIEKMIGG